MVLGGSKYISEAFRSDLINFQIFLFFSVILLCVGCHFYTEMVNISPKRSKFEWIIILFFMKSSKTFVCEVENGRRDLELLLCDFSHSIWTYVQVWRFMWTPVSFVFRNIIWNLTISFKSLTWKNLTGFRL